MAIKIAETLNKKIFLAVNVVILLVIVFLVFQSYSGKGGINYGDTVTLKYTMYYAKNNSQIASADNYALKAGDAKISAAFDKNILGLKAGSKKKFTLAAKDIFGAYSLDMVRQYPKFNTFNKTDTVTLGELRAVTTSQYNITEGAKIKVTKFWPWPILLKKIDGDVVTIEHMPVLNSLYLDPFILIWPIKVTGITNTTVTIEQMPKMTSVVDDEQLGHGRVIDIGSEKITVDYNREFAGFDILFDVEIINVKKAG